MLVPVHRDALYDDVAHQPTALIVGRDEPAGDVLAVDGEGTHQSAARAALQLGKSHRAEADELDEADDGVFIEWTHGLLVYMQLTTVATTPNSRDEMASRTRPADRSA